MEVELSREDEGNVLLHEAVDNLNLAGMEDFLADLNQTNVNELNKTEGTGMRQTY